MPLNFFIDENRRKGRVRTFGQEKGEGGDGIQSYDGWHGHRRNIQSRKQMGEIDHPQLLGRNLNYQSIFNPVGLSSPLTKYVESLA